MFIDPAAIECNAKRLLDLEIARRLEVHPQFLLKQGILAHIWRCIKNDPDTAGLTHEGL